MQNILAYANALGYLCVYMLNYVEIETQNCKNAFHEIEMQKDRTLDLPSALVSFSYNRNKSKNSFTKLIGLTRVTNSWGLQYQN